MTYISKQLTKSHMIYNSIERMPYILAAHIVGDVFCFIASLLIAYQTIMNPSKLHFFILAYSIITLPATIINTIQLYDLVSEQTNALVYLAATLITAITHFFMILDVGNRLRLGDGSWKHPLVLIGIFFLGCAVILLAAAIIVLVAGEDGLHIFFIAGIACGMISDSAVFTYTFSPLIYWKNRVNEGQSRTTALGIWFLFTQNVWYALYGVLYIWFFAGNTWDNFPTLLALDYVLRFIENILYTWPPPKFAVEYMSSKLSRSNNSFANGSPNNIHDIMSSERYNKEEHVEYHGMEAAGPLSDHRSTHSDCNSSRVVIVPR